MSPKNKSYDKKIFRLVYILNKLDAGRKVSTRQLAEEFNVTLRTVQRDLELLNMTGFPLISLEKGAHSFLEGFSLKKVETTKEEASLLSFLHEIAKSLGESFEESFRGILHKVLAKGTESPFYVKVPKGVKLDRELPHVKELQLAIEECRKVDMDYLTPEGEKSYRVDPLKIIYFDGFWYLLLRVDGENQTRKFRLERIKKLEVLDEYFVLPENLKTMLDQSVNIWFAEKRDKKVVLKVHKDAGHFFKQRVYFPLQKIKKENKNGSLTIETKVSHYMEVITTIFQWIPYVKVIEPKELKKEIRGIVKGYVKAL